VDPPGTLVHYAGTRFGSWWPSTCPSPGCVRPTPLRQSYGTGRLAPRELGPGGYVAVQLNYRVGACAEAPFASPATAQALVATYRYGSGGERRQTLPLRQAHLRMRMPSPGDCRPHPRSALTITGLWTTSSEHPIPTSDWDRCSRPGGALFFRSREYQSHETPSLRVAFRLARFRGKGLYPGARVGITAGIDIHGRASFAASSSAVSVSATGTHALGGTLRATVPVRYGVLHVAGVWRCTRD
jgi:hypothetical protein